MVKKKESPVVECIRSRRSVRVFTEKDVPEDAVRLIVDAAQWAPSACNKQAWEFIVVRNGKVKEELVEKAGAVRFMKDAPVVIYVLYRNDVTKEYGAGVQSAAAAVQNMLLAAHDMGLGACWVCHCGKESVLRGILGIPGSLNVVCAVCLGYPKEAQRPPVRKDVLGIMHTERYGGAKNPLSIFPEDWSAEALMKYRENGIRAQSPAPGSFEPRFPEEMKREAGIISHAIEGKKDVLFVLPFSGNVLFEVIRQAGLKSVHVYETSSQVADFIKKKQDALHLKCSISFGIGKDLRLPYANGAFDAVICTQKIEMLKDPGAFISELSRVTKHGGTVVVSFWNKRSVYGLNYFLKTRLLRDARVSSNEGPVRPLSKSGVEKLLVHAGLSAGSFHGINILPGKMSSYAGTGPLKGICRLIVVEAVKGAS
jgi:nitroreductase/SAM-dependent methyltransferase